MGGRMCHVTWLIIFECLKQGRVSDYGGNVPWFVFRVSRENRGSLLACLLTYLLVCFSWEKVGDSVVTFSRLVRVC